MSFCGSCGVKLGMNFEYVKRSWEYSFDFAFDVEFVLKSVRVSVIVRDLDICSQFLVFMFSLKSEIEIRRSTVRCNFVERGLHTLISISFFLFKSILLMKNAIYLLAMLQIAEWLDFFVVPWQSNDTTHLKKVRSTRMNMRNKMRWGWGIFVCNVVKEAEVRVRINTIHMI